MLKSMITNIVAKRMSKKLKDATISEDDVKELLREIRISLLDGDVNFKVVKSFINNIKEKTIGVTLAPNQNPSEFILNIIKQELINILGKENKPINTNKKQIKIMMVGLQGSGKTTTVAKIANYFKNKNQKNPLLVAADIYRPAAIDQLKKLANDLNVDFFDKGTQEPSLTVKQALDFSYEKNNDLVIVDTAGRLQTNAELMEELVEVKKALDPDEILLVVDGMSGQDVINVAEEFNNWLKITGIVITKLDSDARAGAALSLVSILNVPIKFTGVGERIGSLDVFYPERMADRILGLGDIMSLAEKASDAIDEKQARNAFQRMLSGKFDLEDLMKQMEQFSKVGSLGGIMGMIPGGKDITTDKIEVAETRMRVWKYLLSSMTKKERRDPKIFKKQPNRKVRVVKGSGRPMDELNMLLRQWEKGRDKMAEMGKMLKKGKNPFGKEGGGFPMDL